MSQSGISAVWANDGGDKVLAEERRASGGQIIAPAHGDGVISSTWDGKQISLFGARNESIGFNLVIESAGGAKGVSARLEGLEGPDGATIGTRAARGDEVFNYIGRNIELFHVGYLPIKGLSQFGYDLTDERYVPSKLRRPYQVVPHGNGFRAVAMRGKERFADRPGANKHFPDIAVPLEARSAFDIAADRSQSVWIDIHVPRTSPPGVYRGSIIVAERGAADRAIPVALTVRAFTLPDRPSANAVAAVDRYDIAERILGSENRFMDPASSGWPRFLPILDRFAQMLHRHRVVPIMDEGQGVAPPRPETAARLKGTLYSAARGYDGPGKDTGDAVFFIGPYGNWSWKEAGQAEFNRQSDAWISWFGTNAPRTRYMLYLIDEPNLKDAAMRQRINGWLDRLAANPGVGRRLPTMLTAHLREALEHTPRASVVATWYSVADTEPMLRALEAHRKAGHALWHYNGKRPASGSFAIEDDGISLRVVHWAQFKMGIEGWFYWSVSYYNDYQNGSGRTDVWRQARTFGIAPRIDPALGETSSTYSNGEGVLTYPGIDRVFAGGPAPGLNGPVASLRLKLWRRGIQDYEYLTMAMQKNPAATRALVERMVPKVLHETGIHNPRDPTYQIGGKGDGIGWSIDPSAWEAARRQLADLIEGK